MTTALTLNLTWEQINLLSEVLAQYADNSEECGEFHNVERYKLACELRDTMDAKLASLAENGASEPQTGLTLELLGRVRALLISLGDYTGNVDKRTGVDRCAVLAELSRVRV